MYVENSKTLGTCPLCRAVIPRSRLLIKYETAGGWPRTYAECPECHDVVHPE